MSQQLLHHFEFCPDAPQQSRVGVSECVPSESFLNSGPRSDGTTVSAQDRLAPNRFSATMPAACKNPIIWFVVTTDLLPFAERLQDSRMNWHRLLGRFCLARSNHATHDRSCHAHRILGRVYIAPFQTKHLALPQPGGSREEHQRALTEPQTTEQ